MNCRMCGGNAEVFEIDFPFFRHLDFKKIGNSGSISRCTNCFGLSLVNVDEVAPDSVQIYKDDEYVDNKKTTHVAFTQDDAFFPTTYSLQAERIVKEINVNKPNIMDIGCFDAKLLREFALRIPGSELFGFEVSSKYKKYFPADHRFHYCSGSLHTVNESFDVITIINVLLYVNEINDFMRELKRLLKPGGIIFVECPDIDKNPCTILYGDLSSYFNLDLLTNLFSIFGFTFTPCNNEWAPRGIAGFAKSSNVTPPAFKDDRQIFECIKYLEAMKKSLGEIEYKSNIKIVGTTMNAATVYHLVKGNVDFFVDENPNKIGTTFYGKPVHHPKILKDEDNIIIPYGKTSEAIKSKFETKYNGNFICF